MRKYDVQLVKGRSLPQPDAKILNLERLFLLDLLDRDDLAGSLLELPELPEEVPEPGFGHHLIRSEDPHAVKRRFRLILGRQLAADHAKLAQLSGSLHFWVQSSKKRSELERCETEKEGK